QTQTAAARLPRRAMRVIPQALDKVEGLAAVVRAEQRRRLYARVDDIGLIGAGGRDLPGLGDLGVGGFGELDVRRLRFRPRFAEVVTPPNAGTEEETRGAGEEASSARIEGDGGHGGGFEERALDLVGAV